MKLYVLTYNSFNAVVVVGVFTSYDLANRRINKCLNKAEIFDPPERYKRGLKFLIKEFDPNIHVHMTDILQKDIAFK